jgi:hypothetical protein
MLTVAAHSDTSHPGPTYSFYAGHGVFDDDAPVGRGSDASSGGDDALENMSSRQSFQDGVDVGSWRGRSDDLKPSIFMKLTHSMRNPGQGRDTVLANQLAL